MILTKQNCLVMSLELCFYSTAFAFKICFRARNVSGPFEKRAPSLYIIIASRHSLPPTWQTFERQGGGNSGAPFSSGLLNASVQHRLPSERAHACTSFTEKSFWEHSIRIHDRLSIFIHSIYRFRHLFLRYKEKVFSIISESVTKWYEQLYL